MKDGQQYCETSCFHEVLLLRIFEEAFQKGFSEDGDSISPLHLCVGTSRTLEVTSVFLSKSQGFVIVSPVIVSQTEFAQLPV